MAYYRENITVVGINFSKIRYNQLSLLRLTIRKIYTIKEKKGWQLTNICRDLAYEHAPFNSSRLLLKLRVSGLDIRQSPRPICYGSLSPCVGSYCFSVTAKPWGPASVMSSVFRCGSKYALPYPLTAAFWFAQTLSGTQVSTVKVPPVWWGLLVVRLSAQNPPWSPR